MPSYPAFWKTADYWQEKHVNDSYVYFWASSLACYILGTFQLIGALYCYQCPDEGCECGPVGGKKEEKKEEETRKIDEVKKD